jgi:hypothetical protein
VARAEVCNELQYQLAGFTLACARLSCDDDALVLALIEQLVEDVRSLAVSPSSVGSVDQLKKATLLLLAAAPTFCKERKRLRVRLCALL